MSSFPQPDVNENILSALTWQSTHERGSRLISRQLIQEHRGVPKPAERRNLSSVSRVISRISSLRVVLIIPNIFTSSQWMEGAGMTARS